MNDQSELDFTPLDPFEQELRDRWARNEARIRAEWTEERFCIAWATQSDGSAWLDWWEQLPSYERERWLNTYHFERELADLCERPMRSAVSFIASDEEIAQDKAIIESFVRDIRQAALERRPMPLQESDEMDGFARMTFRRRLASAFLEAGVVIIEGSQPEHEKPKRRK